MHSASRIRRLRSFFCTPVTPVCGVIMVLLCLRLAGPSPRTWEAYMKPGPSGLEDETAVTAIYDVRDLITSASAVEQRLNHGDWSPADYATLFGGSKAHEQPPTNREIEAAVRDSLIRAIKTILRDRDWTNSAPSDRFEWVAGRLIVTHTREAHRRIELLLHLLSTRDYVARVEYEYSYTDHGHWTRSRLPPQRPLPAGLDRSLRALDLRGMTLAQAIDALAARSGATIIPEWAALHQVGLDRSTRLTVRLAPGRLVDGLRALFATLRVEGYYPERHFRTDAGAIIISASPSLNQPEVLRVYDVRDLIVDARAFVDELHASTDGASPYRYDGINALTSLTGGVCFAGRLIVLRDPAGHDYVEALLQALRTLP
jgi:hypothetical protein